MEGVVVYDCDKNQIGRSKVSDNSKILLKYLNCYDFLQFAAVKGIGETVVTRIVMFAPGLSKNLETLCHFSYSLGGHSICSGPRVKNYCLIGNIYHSNPK